MAINGTALAITAVGGMFLYAGISNKSMLSVIQNVVTGKSPTTASPNTSDPQLQSNAVGSLGNTLAGAATLGAASVSGSPQAALKQAAATHGWDTGANWNSLVAIENQEAGFNPTAKNPSSGAYGMAQSLGHGYSGGPAPNGVNEYGGEGLTAAQSEQASMGNAYYQSVWMCNYIASRYGNPVVAEQFHLANNWY